MHKVNGTARPRDTTSWDGPFSNSGEQRIVASLAESIMYVCALIADQPRAIDRYIDYFGETRPARRVAPLQAVLTAAPRLAVVNQWVAAGVRKA